MALTKCPECNSKISDKAKSCPSCGMEVDFEKIQKEHELIADQKNKKIIKIALVVGALGFLGAVFSPPEAKKCDNLGAYAFLQTRGINHFKSPSTVEFASYPSANIISSDCKAYNIRTYADAQNAFGATVRSNVVAKVFLDGNQRNIIDIKISE